MTREEALTEIKERVHVTEYVHSSYVDCVDIEALRMAIKALEQPEPQWIPCVDGNEPKANAECWISTNAKYVKRASYAPKANNQPNGFIVTDGGFGFYEYGKSAKAWMPYTKEPEPYRGGR